MGEADAGVAEADGVAEAAGLAVRAVESRLAQEVESRLAQEAATVYPIPREQPGTGGRGLRLRLRSTIGTRITCRSVFPMHTLQISQGPAPAHIEEEVDAAGARATVAGQMVGEVAARAA